MTKMRMKIGYYIVTKMAITLLKKKRSYRKVMKEYFGGPIYLFNNLFIT